MAEAEESQLGGPPASAHPAQAGRRAAGAAGAAQSGQAAQLSQSGQSGQAAQLSQSEQPAQPAQSAEAAHPAQSAKPAQAGRRAAGAAGATEAAKAAGAAGPRPAGAATLRASVTDKIAEAVLDELAETGYARMSMEAVARRAGVGKAAIYRRWESKQAMVLDIVADLAWQAVPVPNTGSLRGDVSAYVAHATAMREDLRAVRLVADLTAEAARSPELARLADEVIRRPRRVAGTELLKRAVARWELSANIDPELALDCLVGLAHARPQALGPRGELTEHYAQERLVDVIMAALPACVR